MKKVFVTNMCRDNKLDGGFAGFINGIKIFGDFLFVDDFKYCDLLFLERINRENMDIDYELAEYVFRNKIPVVVFDFTEVCIREENYIFGHNENIFSDSVDWEKSGALYKKKILPNTVLMFLREKEKGFDYSCFYPFEVLPVEYPFLNDLFEKYDYTDSFEDFSNRPIDVFMVWGPTNISRVLLHGELIKQSYFGNKRLIMDEDDLFFLDDGNKYDKIESKNNLALLFRRWYFRLSIDDILKIQSQSKISISLDGNGTKCFRHGESCINSIMALQESRMDWKYPWIDMENSICLPNGNRTCDQLNPKLYIEEHSAVEKLFNSLEDGYSENLYKIYLEGIKNSRKYYYKNYIKDYIVPNINRKISNNTYVIKQRIR